MDQIFELPHALSSLNLKDTLSIFMQTNRVFSERLSKRTDKNEQATKKNDEESLLNARNTFLKLQK